MLEIRTIIFQRRWGLLGRYEVRKPIRKPHFRGDGRTPLTGAEQPNLRRTGHLRRDLDAGEGMLGRKSMMKKRQQLSQLLFKIVVLNAVGAVAPQSEGFEPASSWRTANAQIDAARIQRMKHPKIFRDFEWTVVRQQHTTRPDADTGSFRANPGDEDFGRRTGQRHDRVMFGNPIPLVDEI